MAKKQNKRVFRRFPAEFDVSVKFSGNVKVPDRDEGELQNISGGGAMFFPCQPEKYYAGQQIEATIYLAGTNDVKACIRTEATIVRVEGAEEDSADRPVRVAIRFDRTFDFERIDSNDTEMKE
ncbi:MAG: PilZ domain-containing protein [Desulfobacterales bacterium]|nr:PilZ domain-containing protein [Desulfobacterales bacterium]